MTLSSKNTANISLVDEYALKKGGRVVTIPF